MKLSANQSTYARFSILIVAVAALNGSYVLFAAHPLPLAAIVACLIPILVVPVVIMPMRKSRSRS